MIENNNKKALSIFKGFGVVLFWLGVWWIAALVVNKELLLPSPIEVWQRFFELIFIAQFWRITAISLLRFLAGFGLAMVVGIALGVLMHKSNIAYALLAPVIRAIRAIPVASFIILALVWIAGGILPIFISFLIVLPVAWSNTMAGIESTDKQLLEMAALYKVKTLRIFRKIYLPSLRPHLLAASTVGLGLAWKAGITAEVIASPKWAIGTELQEAKIYLETADIFVWTVVVIIFSLVLEKILTHLMNRGQR
jgi:NitT/TauT family transport system permease protein